MAGKSEHEDSWSLLYPELLSKEELQTLLKQRYIKCAELDDMEKEELIQLYYKYILPLPQRKYRMNRRGREMTKKQIKMAKKRRLVTDNGAEGEPPNKKSAEETNCRFMSSFNPSKGGESRLKPPPSCINYEKKKIKLSSGSSTKEETSDTVIKGSSTKKTIKLISFSSESVVPQKVTSPDVNKTITLINKHLHTSDKKEKPSTIVKGDSTNDKPQTEEQTKTKSEKGKNGKVQSELEGSPKKKIKIKRISFP